MSYLLYSQAAQLKLHEPVPVTLHPAAVYLSSLSQGSRRSMLSSLNAIARLLTEGECDAFSLDWSKLRYHHTAAVRTALKQRLAPTTTNKMLVALRRVLTEAYRLDLIDANDFHKAVDISNVKGTGKLRGRALTGGEIESLISCCHEQGGAIAIRDAAVLAILRCGGIRRQELVRLQIADLDLATGELTIERGKGGKFRIVYLTNEAIAMVEEWLEIRGNHPGALICPVNKGGNITLRHFAEDGDGIYKLVKARATMAGVKHFSPHDFRRTFCSDLLAEGEDVFTVQELAGHASPATTAKYDRRGEGRKRRAVKRLKFK
ncbi:tyrosine-type recombinase/integrase [Pleurocapsa sp. PCC 7319]|uniref:tyrosine-type recombinase/integrase n=1 Tax=Pleurocapsa sp. PCC 7319 TaxID=118161 RepID=UPI00034B2558|nr:tyrosine-type recombinase/integrase [Pleurocapsa sp. PCC 7319]